MQSSTKPRPLIFGEVLFDQFPDASVLGGAPFNVAWHLQAFGEAPLFISRVGDDELGQRIRRAMQDWELDTTGLQTDADHPTGTVSVHIEHGEPSFEIVEDCAYDHISAAGLPSLPSVSLLYHGSLALRNRESRDTLTYLLNTHRVPVFVDVNLRAPWWDREATLQLLQHATWVKLNEAELAALVPGETGTDDRARYIQDEYALDILVITRGSAGAFARTTEGQVFHVTPDNNLDIVDTVGAGDAFTSVILLGLGHGWSLDVLLDRAQAFASAIVGIRGATVQDNDFYREFAATWLQNP